MKRKSLVFFRCMMRASTDNWIWGKGTAYFYAFRYLRKHQNVKGLRPYK